MNTFSSQIQLLKDAIREKSVIMQPSSSDGVQYPSHVRAVIDDRLERLNERRL